MKGEVGGFEGRKGREENSDVIRFTTLSRGYDSEAYLKKYIIF
jgi:hypothetical protein